MRTFVTGIAVVTDYGDAGPAAAFEVRQEDRIMIVTVIAIASAAGVAVSGRWLTRNGYAQIRWWAVPLFCTLGLVGMPMTISVWVYPSICVAAGGVYLAPWLIGYWREVGCFLGLGWIIALLAISLGKGIRFTCPWRHRFAILVPAAALALLSTVDTWAFVVFRNYDVWKCAAEGVSPDGTRRVICLEWNWLDTSFCFVVTPNTERPLTCRRLPVVGVFGHPDGERRISWSADSQLVCLWINDAPVCVYDFSKAELSSPSTSWGSDKSREEAEAAANAAFATKVAAMFTAHGQPGK